MADTLYRATVTNLSGAMSKSHVIRIASPVHGTAAKSRIANLPNRLSSASSAAQSLAGSGALVFEGELLER